MGKITPVPGYSDEHIHIFLATGLQAAEQSLDQDEVLDVMPVGYDEALAMIANGDIEDSKTIIGLYWARARWKAV